MNINLNQDVQTLDACLKSINNIGSTTYQNICTGESSVVMWGVGDWLTGLIMGFLMIMCIVLLVGTIFMIVGLVRETRY